MLSSFASFFLRTLRPKAFLALGFVLAITPASARAGDMEIKTIISEVGVWDSNPLMLSRDEKALYGSTTTPKITFTNKTPTSKIDASAWVTQNLFDQSSYNSTDLHSAADVSRKNERWQAGLMGSVDYDTTRTSELTNLGFNVGSVRHFKYSLTPNVGFSPSALDRINLSSSFERSVYDSSAYANYTITSIDPSYTRQLTPLTSAVLSAQAQRYQSERDPKRRIDSLSPMVGFSTALTPTVSLRMDGGAQTSKETSSVVSDPKWKWHYVYSSALGFIDEQNDISFKATRARQPFGNGTDSLLTTLALNARHNLNKHITLTFGGSYRFADYDQDTNGSLDTLTSGNAGLAYHLTQTLDLTTTYEYRYEKLTNNGETADRSVARLGLTYTPDWDDILR